MCALVYDLFLFSRHIDTAIGYKNDLEIGKVLEPLFRRSTIKRKDLFLTTKVPPIYMAAEDVKHCVLESMERLQTNYLDLLLIHMPFGLKNLGDGNLTPLNKDGNRILANHDYVETWKEMEKLVKRGVVREIGLSNFGTQQIDEIICKGTIKPVNLQYECHAYLQQNSLRKYCEDNDIISTGYSPLGSPGRPERYQQDDHVTLLDDPVIATVATKIGKTPGQILIRFVSQLGVIPLPKSVIPERIAENFEAMFFEIPDEDMKNLQTLNRNMKYFAFDWAKSHPRFPVGDW